MCVPMVAVLCFHRCYLLVYCYVCMRLFVHLWDVWVADKHPQAWQERHAWVRPWQVCDILGQAAEHVAGTSCCGSGRLWLSWGSFCEPCLYTIVLLDAPCVAGAGLWWSGACQGVRQSAPG